MREGTRTPLAAWAASRALVLGLAVAGSLLWGPPERGVADSVPRALSLLGGWDTTWYLDIAANGYDTFTPLVGTFFTNFAFFPLLPALMATASAAGLNPFAVAVVVSNLAFLAALAGIHRLGTARFGARRGALATWVAALAPVSVYASLAYTEAIVLALAVAAALVALRGWWLAAGLIAAPAALARPPGFLVAVLVIALALSSDGRTAVRLRRAVAGGLPAGVALAGFLAWMQAARGSWRLPLDAQVAWERGPVGVGLVTNLPGEVVDVLGQLVHPATATWTATVRDVGFTVVYALLLWRLRRMSGTWRDPWVVFSALCLALPFSSGSFTSMARFGLLAFPLAWAAADWIAEGGERRARNTALLSVAVTALLVAQLLIRSP
ncbi:MAG: hypothetical protein IT200_01440 [Thermoleophilia bacterium]|nr:hypothetical protein [Thermoleophilia bacterium]